MPSGTSFLRRHLAFLEVPVGAAVLHRATAMPMPRIILKRRPFEQERLARALLGAGEHGAHHHARRAGRERLHDVAGVLDAAVGDDGDVAGPFHRIEDRGELRDADAGDDARRADRARADADLHRVDAALDERARALARRDVAGDRAARRGTRRAPARSRAARRRCDRAPCRSTSASTPASTRARARVEVVASPRRSPPRRAGGRACPCSPRDTAGACGCPSR